RHDVSPPSNKRQRVEDKPVTRSNIWYDDGSVVLQAVNTQFRVHWGILAQHSPFFRRMRGLPQPLEQPSVEGCPVIELPDDPVDVEFILKALYTPTFLPQAALPLEAIGALIRLARKYDFKDLLDLVIARLTFEHPTTLEQFDARTTAKPTRIVPYRGMEFEIISLAREYGILSVLPSAYYRVASGFKLEEFIEGILRSDGTLASLAPVDLRRCLLGREKLTYAQVKEDYARGWYRFWTPDDNCTTAAQCTKMRDRLLSNSMDSPMLRALTPFVPNSDTCKKLCVACVTSIKISTEAGRKRTWDELPGFFELPAWSELKNDP
ncbi:hypothetical protein K438DRAFT_1868531, partial [Mycena galopus ATCC 62051]